MTAPHEGARGPAATGPDAQGTTNAAHSACQAAGLQRKRFERLRAQLAMKGVELHATDGGLYIVRRWGLCRDLRDLAEVECFAKQVGAA